MTSDKYYIGQTQDIAQRLKRHNSGFSDYTSNFGPWELVLVIEKPTRSEAMALR